MLKFQHVSFDYPGASSTLRNVSFSLPVGSCTMLAGRNGAGKSTLVQLCNGLLRPRSGEILIRDRSTSGRPMPELVREVAVMFQHPGDQLTERTVAREVAVGVHALRLDLPRERVQAALDLVELERYASVHPYDLDPAARKLVTLASVLAMRTPIVILDEPFVGLGPHQLRTVERVVRQLRHEGRTVLLVTHDIVQAWPLVDRVMVLDSGSVTLDVDIHPATLPERILEHAGMRPPHARRFLAAMTEGRTKGSKG